MWVGGVGSECAVGEHRGVGRGLCVEVVVGDRACGTEGFVADPVVEEADFPDLDLVKIVDDFAPA